MSKIDIKNNVFYIFFQSLKIYFCNIDKFLLYMLFPIFGQIIGIILVFGLSLGFAPIIAEKFDSISVCLLCVLLLTLPGFLIFTKAFWDYMVAYVALNSMTEGAVTTGRVYDFQSHREVATRRTLNYVLFICCVGVLSGVASSIFFIIPATIFWIYFILIFQVYTFEPDLNFVDVFKRSFTLISGNWLRTFILLIILIFFSILVVSQGVSVIFDYLRLTDIICHQIDKITINIPLEEINRILKYIKLPLLTYSAISKEIFMSSIRLIVMGLTLPLRSICWTLWYFSLDQDKQKKRGNYKKNQSKIDKDI